MALTAAAATTLSLVGGASVSQTAAALVVMNMVSAGLGITAGAVIVGQGVYFGGRLVFRIMGSAAGYILQKVNDIRKSHLDGREFHRSTVHIDDDLGDFEFIEFSKKEVVVVKLDGLTIDFFNRLDSNKLYQFEG